MKKPCPKCGKPMEVYESWSPNDLDKRYYGECLECGWELDDELDEYFMPEKEELIMEADGNRYIHAELYEVTFDDEENGYSSIIGTKYSWKGPVKITIQSLSEKAKKEVKTG